LTYMGYVEDAEWTMRVEFLRMHKRQYTTILDGCIQLYI
jgi:hypothetical protein